MAELGEPLREITVTPKELPLPAKVEPIQQPVPVPA